MISTGRKRSCQVIPPSTAASTTTQSGIRSAMTASSDRVACSWSRWLTSRSPPSERSTSTAAGAAQSNVMKSALIMPSGLTYCTSSSMVGRSCRLRYQSRSTSSTNGNAGSKANNQFCWTRRGGAGAPPIT